MIVKRKLRTAAWGMVLGGIMFSIIFLLISQGCHLIPEKEEEGNVVVQFYDGDFSAQTITPDLDMDIFQFVVTGDGKVNFGPIVVEKPEDYLSMNLRTGDYNLYVSGQNIDGIEVGYGTEPFSILPGQVVIVSVTIKPLPGQGTFTADITYVPLEIIAAPAVDVKIKPVAGGFTDISADFIYGSDTLSGWWNYSNLYDTGWHLLILKVMDGLTPVWGVVESLRIVKGETTALTLNLVEQDLNLVGELDSLFPEEMDNPIAIDLQGTQDNLALGDTMTITAVPSLGVDSYQWFVNADEKVGEITDTFIFDSSLYGEGVFVINVVVIKGNIISSAGHQVLVVIDLPDLSTPTFDPVEGAYMDSVEVTINQLEGGDIYYTTDGTNPTTLSILYTAPFTLTESVTIKAFAVKAGYDASTVVTADYFIDFEITKAEFDGGFYKGLLFTTNQQYATSIGTKVDGDSYMASELLLVEYLNIDTPSDPKVNDLNDIIYFPTLQVLQFAGGGASALGNVTSVTPLLNLIVDNDEAFTRIPVTDTGTQFDPHITALHQPLTQDAIDDLDYIADTLRPGLQVSY